MSKGYVAKHSSLNSKKNADQKLRKKLAIYKFYKLLYNTFLGS